MRDALADVTDLDGRLLRTLRALVSPGFLTTEFVRGRRAPYVGPLKLLLAAGTVLSSSWILTRGIDSHFYGLPPAGTATGDYIQQVVRGLFTASVAIAGTNWILSRGRRRVLDETVFAVHLLAAASLAVSGVIWLGTAWKLLWGTVAAVPRAMPSLPYLIYLPMSVLMLGYVVLAIRRVYGGAWWMTLARAVLLLGVGAAVETLAIAIQ